MLRRIVLENYMSHARTVLELAEGLTVLVGPNNCGKSAVVSALQTLCSNPPGEYMVRHGEREASVTVETADGHVVAWHRKSGTVRYTIDGEEVSRLRGGVPDRLHELLGLPFVRSSENGDDEFDIHFGTQKSPIFLINEPERRAAIFFAASSDAILLLQMQKRHAEKVRDSKRDREQLSEKLVRLDRELAALSPVAELTQRMQQVDGEFVAIELADERLRGLDATILDVSDEEARLACRNAELVALGVLRLPPEPTDVAPLQSLLRRLDSEAHRMRIESQHVAALAALRAVPAFRDIESMEALIAKAADESMATAFGARVCETLVSLTTVPDFRDGRSLEKVIGDYEMAAGELQQNRRLQIALEGLKASPPYSDPAPLAQLIDRFELVNGDIKAQGESAASLKSALAQTEDAIRNWILENPVCQTCGATLDPDRLLEGVHRHA